MLGGADASFEAYRQKHASRDPDLANMRFADELRQLTTAEGLNELASPPMRLQRLAIRQGGQERRNLQSTYGSLRRRPYHSLSNHCLRSDFNVVACPTRT